MPSMAKTISRHNRRLAKQRNRHSNNQTEAATAPGISHAYLWEGKTNGPVVYRAAVTANNQTEYYTGNAV